MWPKWCKISGNSSPSSAASSTPSFKDIHSLLCEKAPVFHRVRIAATALRASRSLPPPDKRIVVYYTSLRVVRKTFEDCRVVRSILRGFRVAVDERDLTMDSAFLAELKGLLGRRQLSLPRVFIGGRYIGGAEEIRRLHESGELKMCVEGAQPAASRACEACGGARFLLCRGCDGSRKCYTEKGGFRACGSCNENGLVRCPECCTPIV